VGGGGGGGGGWCPEVGGAVSGGGGGVWRVCVMPGLVWVGCSDLVVGGRIFARAAHMTLQKHADCLVWWPVGDCPFRRLFRTHTSYSCS
jgi:hypothetical protein